MNWPYGKADASVHWRHLPYDERMKLITLWANYYFIK